MAIQDTKEIIRQVKKIEITTRHLVEGLISGNYHSIFKGQGIELADIREYSQGDDIRAIDWKVTARLNKPFVKEFVEERDLTVYFLFDVSASGSFGSSVEKRRKATELAASLMFAAMRNNDNAGLILFTDKVEKFIPAKKGRRHILKMISNLVSYEPKSRKTSIISALEYASKVVKKKSIIFVISDLFSDSFLKQMKLLRGRHDVIAIRISDKRDYEIPDVGFIELEDEETGEQLLLDTSDEQFRKRYSQIMQEQRKKADSGFRKMKIDVLDITTDEPHDVPLKKFFRKRRHRVVR